VYDGKPRFEGTVCEVDNWQAAQWLAQGIVEVYVAPADQPIDLKPKRGGK